MGVNAEKNILLTGGAGYIGSHTAVELINSGYNVIIADDLSNSKAVVLDRIRQITGITPAFYEIDVTDSEALDDLFCSEDITGVVHFAGYKAVGESVREPLMYYRNNIDSILSVLTVMKAHNVKKLVFSSSATVYGVPEALPITEDAATWCTNPYGWTKLMIEQIIKDTAATGSIQAILLRYFNPIGAHESGLIGEDPNGIPNNVFPNITQIAVGKQKELRIFGDDYDTVDGTGVRDYIHVVDLAQGHLKALEYLNGQAGSSFTVDAINLGTGNGYSVLQLVKAFETASGVNIPYKVVGRRDGDVAECVADVKKAKKVLGWSAQKTLSDICVDAYKWQTLNPNGYE